MDSDSNKPRKFFAKPLAPDELLEAPAWLIKGILPEGFLSLLKGLPGSFKTFETVAMALCVATGLPFCGQRTKRSNVLYVAADDPDGPRMRAQAWIKHHETILKDFAIPLACPNAVLFDQAVNLYQEREVAIAAEDIKRQNLKPDLIVWDTLFHTTLGADLTLPKDVLPIFRRARWLMAQTGARSGLMVHRTPKDGKGTFGSVAIPASVDVIMDSVAKDPDTATLTCERMRRARVFDPIEIKLLRITVKTQPDDEGIDEVDQLVVASGAPAAKQPTREDEDLDMMELHLEAILGNRATHAQWLKQMQHYASGPSGKEPKGWSEASFDRRLATLKKQGRITGGGAYGEYYSVVRTGCNPQASQAPSDQNHPHQNYPQPHPLKGDEGCEGSFEGNQQPSNYPQEGREDSSRESGKEGHSIAAPRIADANDDESGLADEAIQQLKGGK
jgi:hypothetical protein